MVKIAIPIESFKGEDSPIFHHFGRAPMFALATLTQDNKVESIKSVENAGEHFGGHGAAETLALNLNIDAVVVKGLGPRGLQAFQENGVAVYTGNFNTVGEALDSYINGKLSGLTESCKEARHHPKPT